MLDHEWEKLSHRSLLIVESESFKDIWRSRSRRSKQLERLVGDITGEGQSVVVYDPQGKELARVLASDFAIEEFLEKGSDVRERGIVEIQGQLYFVFQRAFGQQPEKEPKGYLNILRPLDQQLVMRIEKQLNLQLGLVSRNDIVYAGSGPELGQEQFRIPLFNQSIKKGYVNATLKISDGYAHPFTTRRCFRTSGWLVLVSLALTWNGTFASFH